MITKGFYMHFQLILIIETNKISQYQKQLASTQSCLQTVRSHGTMALLSISITDESKKTEAPLRQTNGAHIMPRKSVEQSTQWLHFPDCLESERYAITDTASAIVTCCW